MTTLLAISFTSVSRGAIGMATLILIAWLFSNNKKKIDWMLVSKGLAIQLIFAILVLKVSFVEIGFEWVSKAFTKVIGFTQEGTMFLFSSFVSGEIESSLVNFVVMVLPTIVFFSALTSLFYYWGILQKIVYVFAWIMKKAMKLSGAESLAAAGNIFLGQTEAPLLVKPYLNKMTNSELMCLMSGGMATIAGGVLAAYIGFLGGDDPVQQVYFAKHLLAASVMSAPAAVVAAKILVPETEKFDEKLEISKEKIGSNALEAITNGTTDGIKLAVNVGGMLLVFIALMAMGNYILFKVGDLTTLNEVIVANTDFDGLSFQFLLGYLFAPIAWLMGVCSEDMILVGQLLGEKTILNEFVAYVSLGEMKNAGQFHEEKSIIMATYILCGFANFASIGIQIGGIGSLAPDKKATLAKFGFRALIGGTLASLFTAVIVGALL
ncbi:MAG: Na+ dependent nucleoside transporter [Flavobacteriales bacterium]|nr:Na+ dependent nucleoside transporter [Flavobacteriales bacterium]